MLVPTGVIVTIGAGGARETFCPEEAGGVACDDWLVVKTHSWTLTFMSSMKNAVLFGCVLLAENFSLVP
jgi:hypothetical protein